MNTFVKAGFEDEWMREHTCAGYSNHDIYLTQKDLMELKAGRILVEGGEYGITIRWDETITHMLIEADESGRQFLQTICAESEKLYRPKEWIALGVCFTKDIDLVNCSKCLEILKRETNGT